MVLKLDTINETQKLGISLGAQLRGGEVFELVGDIGAGKTTLTKSIAKGMGIDEDVQSPTFTLSRTYDAPSGLKLAHYDFYRISDAGILAAELAEASERDDTVTIVEWAGIVDGVLPSDRIVLTIRPTSEDARNIELVSTGKKSQQFMERLSR